MDILTQYYNGDGQIVTRSPDLTTREFYRDAMCRHRFNEMFVATKGSDGFGFSNASSELRCWFGSYFSGEEYLVRDLNPTVVKGYNDENCVSIGGSASHYEARCDLSLPWNALTIGAVVKLTNEFGSFQTSGEYSDSFLKVKLLTGGGDYLEYLLDFRHTYLCLTSSISGTVKTESGQTSLEYYVAEGWHIFETRMIGSQYNNVSTVQLCLDNVVLWQNYGSKIQLPPGNLIIDGISWAENPFLISSVFAGTLS